MNAKAISRARIVLAAALASLAFWGACSKEERYAEYLRPDGRYKVLVYRQVKKTAMMPGQAGDAPGRVVLLDRNDRVLREASVEMVQLVEAVEWEPRTVHISAIGNWPLPD